MAVILKSDGATVVDAAYAFTTNDPMGLTAMIGVQYPLSPTARQPAEGSDWRNRRLSVAADNTR